MVRFNDKRIKTIYCDFNQLNQNILLDETNYVSNNINPSENQENSQFCKSLGSKPCSSIYSDYPDIPLLELSRNGTSSNASFNSYAKRPNNCEDLHTIGYSLRGLYWVAMSAKKTKLVYCDFREIKVETKNNLVKQRLATQNIGSIETSSKVLSHCNDVIGGQLCSCYYSKFPNILQFELSNGEVTRQASRDNGTGPQSCDELKKIGYTFDGFYMVRFKTNIIKTVYCMFNYSEEEDYRQESSSQSTLTPTSETS